MFQKAFVSSRFRHIHLWARTVFLYQSERGYFYDSSQENGPYPGTGPYILKEYKGKQNILLVRNEKYHQGLPRLSAINFIVYENELKALEDYRAGKLDYLDSVPFNQIKAIRKNPNYKGLYISRPLLETYFLVFNVNKHPFMDSYLLRRALNYAVDREAINDTIFGGPILRLEARFLPDWRVTKVK